MLKGSIQVHFEGLVYEKAGGQKELLQFAACHHAVQSQ